MDINYLQVFLTVSLPIMGLAYALVGGLKVPLTERLHLDEGKVGKLVGGFGTMFGPTILICGFLTDALGRKGVWLAGSIAVAAAVFVFARTTTFRGALVAVLLLGIGWAAQVNVANVVQRAAVPHDSTKEDAIQKRIDAIDPKEASEKDRALRLQLEQEKKQAKKEQEAKLVWATNFFDFVFGFGAFVTPMILALIFRKLGHEKGLILLAVVVALPFVLGLFAKMDPPAPAGAGAAKEESISVLLKSPLFWVLGFAFLFFVPMETSVGGWATTLVLGQTAKDVPPERAKKVADWALSGFWLGFTGSRLIISILGSIGVLTKILGERNEQTLLLAMAVALVALMLAIAFLRGRGAAIATVLLAGLACGPVFPTMIAVVLLSVAPELQGRAVGIFFFFASVGWTVIPALIGAVAKRTGNIQRGFLVAAASAAVFLGFVVVRGMLLK